MDNFVFSVCASADIVIKLHTNPEEAMENLVASQEGFN